jgi:hypothetical protein
MTCCVIDDVSDAFIEFVLKLDESLFKPIFAKSLEWATLATANVRTKLSRGLVFFKIVDKITSKLQNIFVPYFEHLVDCSITVLTQLDQFIPSGKAKQVKHEAYRIEADSMLIHTVSALHKVGLA